VSSSTIPQSLSVKIQEVKRKRTVNNNEPLGKVGESGPFPLTAAAPTASPAEFTAGDALKSFENAYSALKSIGNSSILL
jgi:hypothetical protein